MWISYARGLRYYAFAAREFSYNVDAVALADVVRAAARGDEG